MFLSIDTCKTMKKNMEEFGVQEFRGLGVGPLAYLMASIIL